MERIERLENQPHNLIHRLHDGWIKIDFAHPIIDPKAITWLLLMIGHRKGSALSVIGEKVTGLLCHPGDWLEILYSLDAPDDRFREFWEIYNARYRKEKQS